MGRGGGVEGCKQGASRIVERLKYTYIVEYRSVCSFVGIGSPKPSPPQASVSPPGSKGGRSNTPLRVRGVGGPNSDDWKESLALCILFESNHTTARKPGPL
jgi:hypothetical protein